MNNEERAGPRAIYIGGCGNADLWIIHKIRVLICNYDNDEYVSYCPASALADDAMGTLEQDPAHKNTPVSMLPSGARLRWESSEEILEDHNPRMLALYVAMFAPGVFSEEVRQEVLGITLTKQGELK